MLIMMNSDKKERGKALQCENYRDSFRHSIYHYLSYHSKREVLAVMPVPPVKLAGIFPHVLEST